jgi:hypothetical protein
MLAVGKATELPILSNTVATSQCSAARDWHQPQEMFVAKLIPEITTIVESMATLWILVSWSKISVADKHQF